MLERVGVFGLYLFALSSMVAISMANVGLVLMLIAFLFSPKAWKSLKGQPVFWLCITIIAYISIRAFWASQEFPSTSELQLQRGKAWILLFLFFIVSWWLSRVPQRIPFVVFLVLIGFTLGILSSPDASQLLGASVESFRSGMHYKKPIIFGFHCAVMLLGFLLFFPRMLRIGHNRPRWIRIVLLAAILILGWLFFQGLIISQSRGVWLAAIVVIPFTAYMFYRKRALDGIKGKRRWILWLLVPVFIVLTVAPNGHLFLERLNFERQVFGAILQKGVDGAPLNSSSYRLHMWRFGISKWSERPIVGWGPGSTRFLVEKESDPGLRVSGEPWDHLHSGYVELLLQLGLVGSFLFVLLSILLTKSTIDAYRAGKMPRDLFYFFTANLLLIAIYSLTDFRHLQWNWRFYWLLLTGIGFFSIISPGNRDSTTS